MTWIKSIMNQAVWSAVAWIVAPSLCSFDSINTHAQHGLFLTCKAFSVELIYGLYLSQLFSLETHRPSNVFPSISITPVFMMMFISLQTVEDLYIQHGVMVLEPYRFIYFPNMKLHFTDMYFVYLIIMFLITYCHLYVCVIIGLIFFSLRSLSHRSKILCFPFCP